MLPGPFEGRRNLVIVRAGDSSLHPDWLAGEGERNWDIIVSYFGKDPERHRADDIVRIDDVGPKWPPLQSLLLNHGELLDRYDYIWLPDDDLAMAKQDMNRFFDICRSHDFELAQPSLSADSPMNHPLLIHNRSTSLRYSNFVEVMAPCFRVDFLRRVIPTFSATLSGWGIDWLWPRHVHNKVTGIAIVDDVVIRHTRPLGGPNYDAMRASGHTPFGEWMALMEKEGVPSCRIEFHQVKWRTGSGGPRHPANLIFRARLLYGYASGFVRSPYRRLLMIQSLGRFRQPSWSEPTNKLGRLVSRLQHRIVLMITGS